MASSTSSSKPAPAPKAVRTTDGIIQGLIDGAVAQMDAGEHVDGSAIRQEIIAHQELARLRARKAERQAAGDLEAVNDLNAHISHWARRVSVDVDEQVAADPQRNATSLVDFTESATPAQG
jgi:hypothetical protein